MELHIKLIGVLLMALGSIHITFPKYFQWKEQLSSLSLMNRQMMGTHTFFIALTVFMMGYLCFSSFEALLYNSLGQKLSLGFAIFWTIRLFFQLFVYSPKLWKGKIFETAIHILFTCLWIYFSGIFFLTYYYHVN